MPPLAGRPPYATDDPDSVFGASPQQPQRRMRQPPPDDPNKRTSAYDVYDDYTKDNVAPGTSKSAVRNSGIGNLLLNMGDDSDDDSEDEDERRPRISTAAVPSSPLPSNKTAALAAAIGATTPVSAPPRSTSHRIPVVAQPQFQPQQQQQQQQGPRTAGPSSPPRPHQVIAAPRPGYVLAAPIAALNGQASSISPPFRSPGGPGPTPHVPFLTPSPQQPNYHGSPALPFVRPVPGSPAPAARGMAAPHPLQPPITPITPAFIRPSSASPSPTARSFSTSTLGSPGKGPEEPSVKFSLDQRRPILRGNTEETLLPSRGEKGDDFWRRFSIVAKDPTSSESSWLKKTRSGTNRLSRYVWIVGVFLILAIMGGIGVGVWLSRNSPGHQQPKAIGGSDDHFASGTTTSTKILQSSTGVGGGTTNIVKHVRPTNTVARREPESTPFTNMVAKHANRKKRDRVW